ncbi:uncharacterized protein ISCGN_023422 [Ixodes scapularis]
MQGSTSQGASISTFEVMNDSTCTAAEILLDHTVETTDGDDNMEVTLSPSDTANMEAAQSRSDTADGTRTPASLEGQHRTLPSMHWSSDNLLPQFSSVVQPLLKGLDISKKDHRQHSKQLRHELIHFLNENKLIQDGNCAMRRWKYFALGESLASTYPNMLWEEARKDKKGRTKSPKVTSIAVSK